MWEVIFYSIILLLCLIGVAATIWWLRLRILLPKNGLFMYMLVPVDNTNAEYRLRSAAEAALFEGARFCKGIIAVNMGISDEEMQTCLKLADEYGGILVCDIDDLEDIVLRQNIMSDR